MSTVQALSISSMVQMKPGDMFYSLNGLYVVVDDGLNDGDDITGTIWRHEIRPATDEERTIYKVMES